MDSLIASKLAPTPCGARNLCNAHVISIAKPQNLTLYEKNLTKIVTSQPLAKR
jgi:hypothetical protein